MINEDETKLDQAEKGDTVETDIPLMKERDMDWIVHAQRAKYMRGQFYDLGVMCVAMFCLVM